MRFIHVRESSWVHKKAPYWVRASPASCSRKNDSMFESTMSQYSLDASKSNSATLLFIIHPSASLKLIWRIFVMMFGRDITLYFWRFRRSIIGLLSASLMVFIAFRILPAFDTPILLSLRREVSDEEATVLVTGGMGNIGKYVVRELLYQGYNVIVLDVQDLRSDLVTLLREKGMDEDILNGLAFYYHKGDVRDINGTVNVLVGHTQVLTGIVHLAAVSRVAFCLDNVRDCIDVNAKGTAALLDSVEHYIAQNPAREPPWMIFASSREIYGSNCRVSSPCNEDSAPQPLNLYGETKWQGEQIIRSRSPELLRGHIVLRLASVYGGLFDLSERLIPSLAAKCMTDNAVELNGGDQIFDFVHVDDVVASLLKAASRLETPPESVGLSHSIAEEYLLCSGEHTTAKQILSYTCSLTSCGSPLNIRPADTRYPSSFVCDNAMMRHGLGHNPLYPDIKSGLATYLRSIFNRDIRLLTHSYEMYCAGNNTSKNDSLFGGLQDRKWPKSMHPGDALPLLPERTLVCDHLRTSINHAMQRGSRCVREGTTALAQQGSVNQGDSPICDPNCDVVGGCVNTGTCRCVAPLCGRDLIRASTFPFHAFAFTNVTSFAAPVLGILLVRGRIAKLPYQSVLKAPAAHFFTEWDIPKVHVMNMHFSSLFGKSHEERGRTNSTTRYGSCTTVERFLSTALKRSNTSLSAADYVLIPLDDEWLRDGNNTMITDGLVELVSYAQAMILPSAPKQPRIIVTQGYDGKAFSQLPCFRNVRILSPLGDYRASIYRPHKDVVIPPVTCSSLLFLKTFKDISMVKPSSKRDFLVYFKGSIDDDSSAFLSGTMFPSSNVKIGDIQDHGKYMRVLNNSVFCPQILESTGWAGNLVESIYAGCIPVLTSDVAHPPFWDVLEWSKFAVHVHWSCLNDIEQTLKSLSPAAVNEKQAWLLKVRDAFLYDLDATDQEQDWQRKGPIFHTLLSLQVK